MMYPASSEQEVVVPLDILRTTGSTVSSRIYNLHTFEAKYIFEAKSPKFERVTRSEIPRYRQIGFGEFRFEDFECGFEV